LASEKKTVSADSSTASAERPILSSSKGQGLASSNNSRNSAAPTVITRSNNPYSYSKQENSKQDISKPKTRRSRSTGKQKETSDSSPPETKKQVEEAEPRSELKKLPPYLAFIVNGLYYIGSYPVAFVCKTYSVICFVISLPALTYAWLKYLTYELPLDCAEKSVKFAKEVPAKVLVWLANNLQGLIEICALYQLGGLCCIALAFWFCYQFVGLPFTNNMTYPLFSILRLVLGTLYPAYASYKAVRTKDVKEYVKWMMYWIVFAIFTSVETFADIFVAFWFPFYYEVKILLLIWLISPVSRGSLGSSILYRRFVHPSLIAREEEIDRMILRMQEQGYNTVTKLAVKGFNYASNMVMQTAIRAPGLMNEFIEAQAGAVLAGGAQAGAQRLQLNDLQRSAPSTDTTDSLAEPRFVEVMDIDSDELNQDNLNQTVDNSLVSDQEEPALVAAATAKAVVKKSQKKVKKAKSAKKRPEISSDSDPDFEPEEEEPSTSNAEDQQVSTRLRTRNRSKSTKNSS